MNTRNYGYIRELTLCILGIGLLQTACSSGDLQPEASQEESVPITPGPLPTQPKLTQVRMPEARSKSLLPSTGTADAGQDFSSASESRTESVPDVHFELGDWSGSLSERRVHSTLRQVHKRLLACAEKHQAYGTYEIFYRLNDSLYARRPPKKSRWVYPIAIEAKQESSAPAIQCIKYSLAQQSHFMRKYKSARVSGILSIVR